VGFGRPVPSGTAMLSRGIDAVAPPAGPSPGRPGAMHVRQLFAQPRSLVVLGTIDGVFIVDGWHDVTLPTPLA